MKNEQSVAEILDFARSQYRALVHNYNRESRNMDFLELLQTIQKLLMLGSAIHIWEEMLEIPDEERMMINGKIKGASK